MVFTVLAAVDLNAKCNFELTFPGKPSIAELRSRVDRDLGAEAQMRRPGVPFAVSRVQVFDERLQMWVDLVAAVQLEDYCQLYVFQVESPYCRDLPGHIPPPQRPAVTSASPQRSALDVPTYDRQQSPIRARSGSPHYSAAAYPPIVEPPQPIVSAHASPYRIRADLIERASEPPQPAPTVVDKVRIVYDEMDTTRSRKVTLDNWRETFERLRISAPEGLLSIDTVDDLFRRKADRNQDSILSFQEWVRFAELYPKLLDCLFYRSRALAHEKARKENLERAQQELEALERRLSEAGEAVRDAEAGVEAQQDAVRNAEDSVASSQDKETRGKQERDDAHQQSEEAKGKLREATVVRDRSREDVRVKDASLRQAQRNVLASEKKRDGKEGDVERAKRELERLRQILQQQEAEVTRQEQELTAAEHSVEEAKQVVREKETDKEAAESSAQAAQMEVGDAEAELKARLDKEGEQAQAHRDLLRDVANAHAQHDKEKKELLVQRQKAEARQRAQQRSQEAVDEHTKVHEELQEKDRSLDEKRKTEQQKEDALIEGEIRLREQRDTMEEKERALTEAANDFAQETGRLGQSQSPLREAHYQQTYIPRDVSPRRQH